MKHTNSFEVGRIYLLNDKKNSVFVNEPAVYIGEKDSDMHNPYLCAVCGSPLGGTKYHSFSVAGYNKTHIDIVVGHTCIDTRIESSLISGTKKIDTRINDGHC